MMSENKKSLNKKLLIVCLLNFGVTVVLVSAGCVFFKRFYLKHITDVSSSYSEITERMISIEKSLKADQQQIASFQRQLDYSKYKIPPLILELEKLIEKGEPLKFFLEEHRDEIQFETGLWAFADRRIPTVQELQSAFKRLYSAITEDNHDESDDQAELSFLEKYKRIIKKKVIDKIKVSSVAKEKKLFDGASELMKNDDLKGTLKCFNENSVKIDRFSGREELKDFITELKLRIAVDEEFEKFKKQFARNQDAW
jgi:hypothetical protein